MGLDRANHVDRSAEISLRVLAQRPGLRAVAYGSPILFHKPARPTISTLRRKEVFQQPEDMLRARVVQVMQDKHGGPSATHTDVIARPDPAVQYSTAIS